MDEGAAAGISVAADITAYTGFMYIGIENERILQRDGCRTGAGRAEIDATPFSTRDKICKLHSYRNSSYVKPVIAAELGSNIGCLWPAICTFSTCDLRGAEV